jgi:hypothetical protein
VFETLVTRLGKRREKAERIYKPLMPDRYVYVTSKTSVANQDEVLKFVSSQM